MSRWFNYYASGIEWSVTQAPHIDGIYYDGIGFDRLSFRRIRRLLDSRGAGALIDIHTGEVEDAPSSVRYIGHFPFADSVWNGEGFRFELDRFYWLVDVSGIQHGISADRLGGDGLDVRGMAFAMTERNSDAAFGLWSFWDDYAINQTTMIGWWEDDSPVNVTIAQTAFSGLCAADTIVATVFTAYSSHAILVLASWCTANATARLAVDWPSLGFSRPHVSAPAIAGVQPASAAVDIGALQVPPSGIILVASESH